MAPPVFFQNDRLTMINDDILTTRRMKAGSVDLLVTSPPYNVDIQYGSHDDGSSYEEYLSFSKRWMARCYRWLADSGRFCLNIPLDKNKGGQQSVGNTLFLRR